MLSDLDVMQDQGEFHGATVGSGGQASRIAWKCAGHHEVQLSASFRDVEVDLVFHRCSVQIGKVDGKEVPMVRMADFTRHQVPDHTGQLMRQDPAIRIEGP